MAATKIFVTGATGYIGGDALFHLTQNHSDLDLALLVRSESKAKHVQAKYPKARIVLGSLDDADIIRREAAWADIVLREFLAGTPDRVEAILTRSIERYGRLRRP